MKQISARIISSEALTKGNAEVPQANLVCIEAPEIATTARPGQFVMISCGPDVILRRPLSIHLIDTSGRVYFLFVVIGKGTSWLSQRRKGDKLNVIGPLGNGFSMEPASEKLLLIAGGIGISPLTFLAHQALNQGKQISLISGARTKSQLYQQNLLHNKIDSIILTDDGSNGIKGKISDFQYLPTYISQADQVFACGPLPMYQALYKLIDQKSLKKNVQMSLETRMGCGFGICYGCSIETKHGTKTVCQDGPVFDMKEIVWQQLKI